MKVKNPERRPSVIDRSCFPVDFAKMSGAGNDFVVIDNRDKIVLPADQREFCRRLCRRMFSVGADGVIFIEKSDAADFGWNFYNGDGSVAEMCGNGARCAARFAHSHKIAGPCMKFETLAGIIAAEVLASGDGVRLEMVPPSDFRQGLTLTLDGVEYEAASVNTGVPHAVIFVDREDVPVKKWGRSVRYHQLFRPDGTNVNFARVLEDGRLQVRTYERGVEAETMACGTGAVAAALYAAVAKAMASPVEVLTSGGEMLTVFFDLSDGPVARNVFLQGPARHIYDGQLTVEALL
ncbi:MAG: diaminopimelate epimerase [Deltaproteobacteria bacterium]|nr:diaminopimelate epimerase [Deltaproteobacteria bacterium]